MAKNKKLPMKDFEELRRKALETWPTGKGVNLSEGIKYHSAIPAQKNFAQVMKDARDKGKILLQPRAGVALIDEHIRLLQFLETSGGADLLPTTIDAYTRQNRYTDAAKGIEKSTAAGSSLLNGFPAVNHGVEGCRRVVESVHRPIQVRHGTPDARLLAEITLCAGFTSFEGGGISYNIPYTKKVPLEKSIADWQYVDRLVGVYEDNGIRINREPFGPLTGTLVPPCISHAVAVLEGLLALEQGVHSLTLGYGQCGCIVQDMAAILSLRELAAEYFTSYGFTNAEVTTVFHQWMGGFPEDEAQAFGVISFGATAGACAKADKIIVKSPHEAMGIPTKEANAQGLRATRQVINMLADQYLFGNSLSIRKEADLIKTETRALVNKAVELGKGDIAAGCVAAFQAGVIDVPFAPSIFNAGKVLPARDNEGFVRIFNKGNLALPADILDYHRQRLVERARAENRELNFQMVTDDIYAIGKGRLIGRNKQ